MELEVHISYAAILTEWDINFLQDFISPSHISLVLVIFPSKSEILLPEYLLNPHKILTFTINSTTVLSNIRHLHM